MRSWSCLGVLCARLRALFCVSLGRRVQHRRSFLGHLRRSLDSLTAPTGLCLSEVVALCCSEAGRVPSQEVLRKSEKILKLCGSAFCSSQVVVLRCSGAEGASSREVPRPPAEVLGLSDGADGALCLSEVVAPCWSEVGSAPSQKVLRLPEETHDSSLRMLCLFVLSGPGHFASTFSRRESGGRQ